MSSKTAGGAVRREGEAGDSGLAPTAGTERVVAAAAIEADTAGAGFWQWSAASGRLSLSPGLLRIAGLDAHGFAGTAAAAAKCLHPADLAALRVRLAALAPGANRWRGRYRLQRADRTTVELVATVSVEGDAHGRPLRASGTCMALDAAPDATAAPAAAPLLDHITRVVPSLLYVLEVDARRNVFANRTLSEILGYGEEETAVTADWVQALMHPDDAPRFAAHVDAVRDCADGETRTCEYRLRHADGEWRWFLSRETPFARDAQGRVSQVVGAATDITERRRTAAQLAASESVFRELAEANLVGIGVGDTRGGITYVNDEMLRMMGYTRGDYEAGRVNWAECLDAESRAAQADFTARLLREGRLVGYERAFRRPDGGRTPYLGAAAVVEPGSDLHVSFALDLSRVRDTEEALRLASERFRTALGASPVVVFNQDRELRYTWIQNPALGYEAESVIGKRDADLFERAEDAAATEAVKRRVIATGQGERVQVIVHYGGEARSYDLTVQALRDVAGTITGVTCAAVDVTERRRGELRVVESERQLRRVLDSLFVFVGVMTPDGTLIEANRAPLEAGGLMPEDVIGRKFWDCPWWTHDPEVQRRCREACERAAQGEPSRFDIVVRMRGDSRMTIDFTVAPMRDASGRITHLIPSAVEIDERVRAEAALRESEQRLKLALRAGQLGFWDWHVASGRVVYGGEWAAMLGYAPEEIEPHVRAWESLLHPDDREATTRALDAHVSGRTPFYEAEHRLRAKDGRWVWVLGRGMVVERDADGRALRAIGTNQDISARREAEAALRQSEERLAAAQQAGRVGVFDWDYVAGTTLWTRELEAMFGYAPGTFGGTYREWADRVVPEDLERLERTYAEWLATPAEEAHWEYRITRADTGEVRWIAGRGRAVRDAQGRLVRIIGTNLDITGMKRVELALRESEEHLRYTVEMNPQVPWTATPEGRIDGFSDRWLQLTGMTRERALGEGWEKAPHPDDVPAMKSAWVRAVRSGEPYDVEHRVRLASGEYRWMRSRAFPRRDAEGRIVRWYGTTEDVDERRRAEAALRESERRFKLLADAMPQLVWTASPDGRVDYYNARRAEYRAASTDDADRWEPLVHPDDIEATRAAWVRAAASGEPYEMEHRLQRADGEFAWHLSRGVPVRDAEGRIAKWYGTATDIDARKRAEAALQERTALLQALTENTDDLIWAKDRAGRLTLANPAIVKVFPRHAKVVGLTMAELIGDTEQAAVIDANDQRIMANGQAELVEEAVGPPGAERVFVSSKTPLRDAAGAVVGVTGVSRDITARKQLEAERDALLDAERHARAEAERANQLKDEFLATVSHELRTPLNAMLGWTQVLARRQQDPALVREGLAVIERNARAQAQLIEDLLDMSRIISGKLRLDVQTVDLHDVVSRALETIRPVADAKSIRLSASLDVRVGAMRGDPDRLQQVVWNLLSNAVKFTPRSGWVELRLVRRADDVELRVRDSGQGIAPELLPHVFDRFRQGDGTASRRQGGLGLGLSIVRQLVELHGGSVRAESEGIGHGATFVVELPLGETEVETHFSPLAHAHWPPADTRAPATLRGVVVLIVDDEPDSLRMLVRVLEEAHVKVLAAHSAEEALAMLARERPHVLLSDLGMPGVDGYALIRRVRALAAPQGQVPAVAITAYARAEDRERALAAGYQAHVAKPVHAHELLALIESLLR
jgi:PAS domain S-box-containing protein